jgi:hypothetical protein
LKYSNAFPDFGRKLGHRVFSSTTSQPVVPGPRRTRSSFNPGVTSLHAPPILGFGTQSAVDSHWIRRNMQEIAKTPQIDDVDVKKEFLVSN